MYRRVLLSTLYRQRPELQRKELTQTHTMLTQNAGAFHHTCSNRNQHSVHAAKPGWKGLRSNCSRATGGTVWQVAMPSSNKELTVLRKPACSLGSMSPTCQNCLCLCLRGSAFHTSSSTSAGHNKWSKVKHIKGPKDLQKSQLASKIIAQMRVVMREGGSNPDLNPDLARLIAHAKSSGIPKATIENCINNAAKSKDKGGSQYLCEAQGTKGSAIIAEYVTENQRRSREELVRIFKAHGCAVGGQGSVLYAFSRKGVLELSNAEGHEPLTYDLAMELAIDAGAEDVIVEEEDDGTAVYKLMCDQADFRSVRSALGETVYASGMASLEYLPESTVALSAQELEKMGALITNLEEHPEVLKVSHNMAEET